MVQIDQHVILSFLCQISFRQFTKSFWDILKYSRLCKKCLLITVIYQKKSEEFNHFLIYAFGNMNPLSINN